MRAAAGAPGQRRTSLGGLPRRRDLPTASSPTARAPSARHPPLFVRVRRMLETVASVYFTCFKCARTMLQVFHTDVAILHVFHTNVVSVLFRCCIFIERFRIFHATLLCDGWIIKFFNML